MVVWFSVGIHLGQLREPGLWCNAVSRDSCVEIDKVPVSMVSV